MTAIMPKTGRTHAGANRVGAQRRTHRALFQVLDARRQRARTQRQRQVLRLLLGEAAGDAAFIVNLLLDGGHFHHLVVEHHGQPLAHVRAGERGKPPSAFAGQRELHVADAHSHRVPASAVRRSLPLTADARLITQYSLGVVLSARSDVAALHQHGIRGKQAAVGLHRFLLAGVGAADRLPDFQHRGGLHDFFHARRIVNARQLHQDLVVAQSVLLDHRLADAELVNAVADGLDRLLHAPWSWCPSRCWASWSA